MGIVEQNVDSRLLSPCVGLSCSHVQVPGFVSTAPSRVCSSMLVLPPGQSPVSLHWRPRLPPPWSDIPLLLQVQKSGWCISGTQRTTPDPLRRGRVGAGPGVPARVQMRRVTSPRRAPFLTSSVARKLLLCPGPRLSRLRNGNNNTLGDGKCRCSWGLVGSGAGLQLASRCTGRVSRPPPPGPAKHGTCVFTAFGWRCCRTAP